VVKPFQRRFPPTSPISDVSITYSLSIFDSEDTTFSILKSAVNKFNDRPILDSESILRLNEWAVIDLFDAYIEGARQWKMFLISEMENYCKRNSYSKLQWLVLKRAGAKSIFSLPLSFEQRIWIAVNERIDREDHLALISQVRDSLLPWLDIDLWRNVEKKKDNTRENVDYDKQKRSMVEGADQFNDEDLDVIV